jgi:hypothetical protein
MRYRLIILAVIGLVGFSLTSCEPEDYKPIGEPFDKIEGMVGTWKITSVVQVDEEAIAKDLSFTELNITNFFDFSNYRITFNVDEENKPSTFEVVNPDKAPNFITVTGRWAFDNENFPSYLYLIRLNALQEPLDTNKLFLNAPPRLHNPLKFKFTRYSGEEKILSYKYSFERVNQ